MSHLDKYYDHLFLGSGLRDHTAKLYCAKIRFILDFIGKEDVTVTRDDLMSFIGSLKSRHASNTTIRLYVTVMKSFWGFLKKFRYLSLNPAKDIRPPKAEAKIPDILTRDEVESMITSVGLSTPLALRNSAILCLLADTGIRVSELIQLRFGHIKREKMQFILNVPSSTKSYRARQIPFCYFEEGGLVSEHFLAYYTFLLQKGARSEQFLFQTEPCAWKRLTDGTVIPGKETRGVHQLSRIDVYNIVRAAAKKAGISHKPSPHSFRHFYATYLAVDGMDVYKIKERLGHSSLERTQIYIHYADIVKNDSAKNNPLSGIKTKFTGFAKIMKENK